VIFIITEQHGKCKHLQQHKADKSEIPADEEKYVTHLELRHKVQNTRYKKWSPD